MSQQSRASSKWKTFITWTPFMDKYMADILIEQVISGVKSNHNLRAIAMNVLTKGVGERFHVSVDVNNCRNRLLTFCKHFQPAKEALNKSGFSWDEERKYIIVEEEVWKEFMKLHLDASKIKNKPFLLYHDMEIICGEENAAGNTYDVEFTDEVPPHHPMDDISISCSPFGELGLYTPLDADFSEETSTG